MAVSSEFAAKYICDRGNWSVTNLQLHKIMYIAHMIHMGQHSGARLINSSFEAWDYGPVEPHIYHKVKMFGSNPVENVFYFVRDVSSCAETATLDEACSKLLAKKPGELVAMTHWDKGAWARNYRPGVRGIKIPDADILAEYAALYNK